MTQDYFLGLDMGTGSLGWAVTNEDYEIVRSHGKSMWGVRLFETASTAQERRTFRTSRRRLQRRKWRMDILQGIFAEEVDRIDDGFFLRMKESRYVPEDKRDSAGHCPDLPYALFIDTEYTDKEYHNQFPTIYHLRKWLMETDETPDIRLVYLGIHHIYKHRGHFLFSGTMDDIREFETVFRQLMNLLDENELDFHLSVDEKGYQIAEDILKDHDITRTTRKSRLIRELHAQTACEKELLGLLCGCSAKLSRIYGENLLDESERPKLSFADSGYDDYIGTIEADLGERFIIIEAARAVYDWSVLTDILGEYNSLSAAKVASYDKHRKDLRYLKQLVKSNLDKSTYEKVFSLSQDKLANYVSYVGVVRKNGKKCDLEGKRCSQEEFYHFLNKEVVEKIAKETETEYLRAEMEKGTFLPRQVTRDNSVIPYQVHLYELNQIIANLKDRVPLLEQYEDQIRKTFLFRIPYYIGPLNGIRREKESTNWAVRKNNDKIYPWNFEDVIDVEASAERFIRRMTSKCTYLPEEDVLPQKSLLYSKFMVLNELNNLCINGMPVDVQLKQRIYIDLFQHYRRVTQKKLKSYLRNEGIVRRDQNIEISGIDEDFKSSLTAYHDFKEKLTGCSLSEQEMEEMILEITLFGDDKKLLARRLMRKFPFLTDNQIKAVSALSYRGWGRLSRAFLEEITAPMPGTAEEWSIIRSMWETNENLMQLLSNKYLFMDSVKDRNGTFNRQEITYGMVRDLHISPAVKREIWQTLLVVKELSEVLGGPPKRVFVEMARENGRKGRTESRKKRLTELYRKCREEEPELAAQLNAADEASLRSDKLYLYYTQRGRCMYSGELIEIDELWDNSKYDIDHIYPQSRTMDDSLDNRVLVKKQLNAGKSDTYPIRKDIREKMQPFWKSLLFQELISREKYERLIRGTGFEPDELAGFISRQLVETRQATKAVASILQQVLPDSEIVYVKANIVSQFRQDYDFIKVREMNDLHHAKDAYLNVVVGNTYYVKFTKDAVWYIQHNPGRTYNLRKMFTSDWNVSRDGETAWIAGESGTICTVRNVMSKNNVLVTRRASEAHGGLFDQQLMKKGKGQVYIKESDERLHDIDKYGGYNKANGAYYMLVESEGKKGQKIRTIEYIPQYMSDRIQTSDEAMRCFFEERGLQKPVVLLKNIKIDSLFCVEGFRMWLSGRTGNHLVFKGANQLLLSENETATLKKALKFAARFKENKEVRITERDRLKKQDTIALYDTFLDKLENTVYQVCLRAQAKTLSEKREIFIRLSLEDQCLTLCEILHIFQCQSGLANLKKIGGGGQAGRIQINYNITGQKDISIIHQSVTGIYEQKINLLTL